MLNWFLRLQVAERDGSERDWARIRQLLSQCAYEEQLPGSRTVYRVRPEVAAELARECVYIERERSGRVGSRRPLFDQMKRDAALRRFDRLLIRVYPAPSTFLWDPWAAKVDRCCYIIDVRVYDRAIVNNSWSGGHSNENWQSITIA